jgi:alpha-galactosidase
VWFGSSPTPTPTTLPPCVAPAWSANIVYATGDMVSYSGREWRAKWSNSGSAPSSDGNGNPWEIMGFCSGSGGGPTATAAPPTATRTPTGVPPTATRTPTSAPGTATRTPTRTPTGVPPTATRTPTSAPATATPTRTSGTCQVSYTITSQWQGGFQADVKITNTGTTTINGWTAAWSFANGQMITQLWSASYTQSGANVSATNLSWNTTIAPAGSQSFGFTASWNGTNAKPTSFTLNGAACLVQ